MIAMSSKVMITSEFPTSSEVAARLGISPSRAAELKRWVYEMHGLDPEGNDARPANRKRRAAHQPSRSTSKKK
jgi:hypothetical protein